MVSKKKESNARTSRSILKARTSNFANEMEIESFPASKDSWKMEKRQLH